MFNEANRIIEENLKISKCLCVSAKRKYIKNSNISIAFFPFCDFLEIDFFNKYKIDVWLPKQWYGFSIIETKLKVHENRKHV